MTTVKRVQVLPCPLRLKRPLHWGKGQSLAEPVHVLVGVELADGARGVAEAPPRPGIYGETVESICAIVEQELAPRLVGQQVQDFRDLARLQAQLTAIRNNHTARGALDLALHSALARSRGIPLAQLIEATRPTIRVSSIVSSGERANVLQEAQEAVAAGLRVLKVKVGRAFARDLETLRELREVVGDGVTLYADVNECFNAENARPRLAALAALDVRWCEEPLPVAQLQQRAALRADSPLPLIADDSVFSLAELERELAQDSFDILNVKTARNGFSEALAMEAAALAGGKGVMVGSQAGSMIGCLHALLFGAREGVAYPVEGSFFLRIEDHYAGLLPIEDGAVQLGQVEAALTLVEEDLLRRFQ
ncbi:MAG: enolase [Anaerolineae bacterium]|nr:enolase [Anaerolineae bacterium]